MNFILKVVDLILDLKFRAKNGVSVPESFETQRSSRHAL